MAEKITYILGAGASFGAFPLVKGTDKWNGRGLADDLIVMGESLNPHRGPLMISLYGQTIIEIKSALDDTGKNANAFGNIDTYAKYLYHTGQKEKLKKLKVAMTFYFMKKQLCDKVSSNEKRYAHFITSIVDDRNLFPEHVKILSWNYDYLLEQASSLYRKEEFSEDGKVSHRSPAFVEYFPHHGYRFNLTHPEYIKEKFSLLHLNGIAGFYIDKSKSGGDEVFHSIFNDVAATGNKEFTEEDLFRVFQEKHLKQEHLITFAWEKRSSTQRYLVNTKQIVQEVAKDTTILVVIGYSFPFYNREIDNMVFETIKPTLNKIYFQDPNNDGTFLRKRYDLPNLNDAQLEKERSKEQSTLLRDIITLRKIVDVEHIPYTDQFYIPIEL